LTGIDQARSAVRTPIHLSSFPYRRQTKHFRPERESAAACAGKPRIRLELIDSDERSQKLAPVISDEKSFMDFS
jgi:hypothetical protein